MGSLLCDCGDKSLILEKGFCENHCGVNDDEIKSHY